MRLFQTIKDVIFKIKDYDRLESDYSSVLDYATGGVLSKTNYTLESVYDAIRYNVEKHDEYVEHDYLEQLKKGAVETEVKGYLNGKGIYIETDIPVGIDVEEGEKVKLIIIKEE